jgi:hypothetical protein
VVCKVVLSALFVLVDEDGHFDWRIRECVGLRLGPRSWEVVFSERRIREGCGVDGPEPVWIGDLEVDLAGSRVERAGLAVAAASGAFLRIVVKVHGSREFLVIPKRYF